MTTLRNPELGTSDPEDAPVERENAPQATDSRKSVVTNSDIKARTIAYFTPPSILTDAPESIPAKRRYARSGDWIASVDGPIRKLGIGYWRVIALPVSVVAGYVTWIADRPGRALIVYGLWRMVIGNPPGPWLTKNILTPAGSVAAWLFL